MNDPFDFSAFIANAANPGPNAEGRKDIISEAVSDQMGLVMGEVCPRIWAVVQQEMQKDKDSAIHLNAVLNSLLFATFSWLAVCTPEGETEGQDNDDIIREKVQTNLTHALANCRKDAKKMAGIAGGVGRLKLMEDALAGTSAVITANSMIVKGIHEHLKKGKE